MIEQVRFQGFRFAVVGHDDIALPEFRYGDFHWLKDAFASEAGLGGLVALGDGEPDVGWMPPIERTPWRDVTDPLKSLLMPKDTNGRLSPVECLSVASRIEELTGRISSGQDFYERRAKWIGAEGDLKAKVATLVAAMRECARRGVDLTWS